MGGNVVGLEFEHPHEFHLRERRLLFEDVQVAKRDVDPRVVGRRLGRRLVVLLGRWQFGLLHRLITRAKVLVDRLVMAAAGQRYTHRGRCRQHQGASPHKSEAPWFRVKDY